MSKGITEKIKQMLTKEDLAIFEGAVESMVAEKVTKKVNEIVALREEELKKEYAALSEQYVKEQVEKQVLKEKTSIMETYDSKLVNLEDKIVSRLDSFLETVNIENIKEETIEKAAINESLLPLVTTLKETFSNHYVELDTNGDKVIKELKSELEKSKKDLKEAYEHGMMLEQRIEKSAVFLLMSEKTHGLKNSDKKRVVEMFKDKKFDEVEDKIDGFINLIKENNEKPVNNTKPERKIVAEKTVIEEPKTIVNEEESFEQDDIANLANGYLFS